MSNSNWQPIAILVAAIIAAIASLLGPSLAVVVKARIGQPKENPNKSRPSERGRSRIVWLPLLLAVCSLSGMAFVAAFYGTSLVTVREAMIFSLVISMNMATISSSVIAYRLDSERP